MDRTRDPRDVVARQVRSLSASSSSRSDPAHWAPTKMSVPSAFSYCADRVRTLDYENYLCTLFLPKEHRAAALALRAFNVETASALGVTKEPQLALMRLKWWSDVVDTIHERTGGETNSEMSDEKASNNAENNPQVPDHPVAIALHALLGNGAGSARTKRWLKAVAKARVRDAEMGIENKSPAGMAYLEAYAESTSSSLLYAQLDIGAIRETNADHAASHLGKAVGITNLLRGTHHHSKQRRCYLPLDVCVKHGLAVEDVYRGKSDDSLKNAVHEVASLAKAHLDSARAMAEGLGSVGKQSGSLKPQCVLLPAIGTATYLENLEAKDFDVFHPELIRGVPPLVTQGKIAWAAMRGKY